MFEVDALESSGPLAIDVTNPLYEIGLSRLSYGKGNCLLRMVQNAITSEAFEAGVHNFLVANHRGSAPR